MVWRRAKNKTVEKGPVKSRLQTDGQAGLATALQPSSAGPVGSLTSRNVDTLSNVSAKTAQEFQIPIKACGSQRAYVIPRNYRVKGEIRSDRRILIRGELADCVVQAPAVTVTESGSVCGGRVAAGNLQVAGSVDAELSVTEAVEVSGRGRVSGSVSAPKLRVSPGAVLNGALLKVGAG